jgi:hypothetical protein
LLEGAGERLRQRRDVDSTVRQAHDLSEAGRILALGLQSFALTPPDLPGLKKGDPRKLAIARVIRLRKAADNRWIAGVLAIGHPSRLNHRPSNIEAEITRLAAQLEKDAKL